MLLLFIPIGITVNLAEKIDRILENEVPFEEVASYYFDFTIYFATLLFPLFLFLSVIWFTSKLANNTEIVAFLSSGVSFTRFLRPYLVASKGFNEFTYKYLKNTKVAQTSHIHRQINENEYIYVSNFDTKIKRGNNFTLEHFEGNKLAYKIHASVIRYIEKDSSYQLTNYNLRTIGEFEDELEYVRKKDTIFNFDLQDLTPPMYVAETLTYGELLTFIAREEVRGSSNINRYKVVQYKKWSLPVSVFILTIIAVAVSSVKRRGGMGVNLAFGIVIAMIYVFFDKVFGVMAEQSDFSPLLAVWFPNILFGSLAIYLLYNAKR
jgi:lipopolysaccharide export system permease protein